MASSARRSPYHTFSDRTSIFGGACCGALPVAGAGETRTPGRGGATMGIGSRYPNGRCLDISSALISAAGVADPVEPSRPARRQNTSVARGRITPMHSATRVLWEAVTHRPRDSRVVTRVGVCASVVALAVVLHAGNVVPKRLAIYYGFPSLVEGADGSVAHAVRVFSAYDVMVFGDGLELGGTSPDADWQQEERLVGQIVARLHMRPRKPLIYGYIGLGRIQPLADAEIIRRVDAWRNLGADGIFFDEAGRESGFSLPRRSAAVRAVHERGLSALMNALNPDDLFDKDSSRAPTAGDLGANDALLIESFAVENSVVLPRDRVARRAAAAFKWRDRTGIKVYAVTTTVSGRFDASSVVYAERLAADLGVDAFGWGEPNFSMDAKLPWRFER